MRQLQSDGLMTYSTRPLYDSTTTDHVDFERCRPEILRTDSLHC